LSKINDGPADDPADDLGAGDTTSPSGAAAKLSRLDVRKIARPEMQELADVCGATVSLGTRDRLSMIYVQNYRGSVALTLTLEVGSRIPVATSAIGRAWLAAIPEHDRLRFMEQVRELDHVAWPKQAAASRRRSTITARSA